MLDLDEGLRALDLFNPTEEHRLLRQMVRDFVRQEVEPQAAESNREEKFNVTLFRKLGALGLHGVTIPEEYGGSGMDAVAAVIVHEELAWSDPGLALAYLAHAILYVNNVFQSANEEQRRRLLPKALTGEWLTGMGMTEPGAGTDVLAMQTRAVREGDHYRLTGRKTWITNGGYEEGVPGDAFLIYAKTGDRISSFVVEKDMPGFGLGQKFSNKLGMRSSMSFELVFEDCRVPAANRLGEEGESLLHMMRNLEIERVTLAAISLGIARRSLEIMVQYAQERRTFGVPIYQHGQIQRRIAWSYAYYKAARTYTYDMARRLRLDRAHQRVDADGVKYVAAEVGKTVADHAIQVLGGNGYAGEYVVERLWRDARLLEIGGGTLEAHEKNITKDLVRDPGWLERGGPLT